MRDVLETNVPDEYYLSERCLNGLQAHNENHQAKGTGFIFKPKEGGEVANALRANGAFAPTDNAIKVAGEMEGGAFDNTLNCHKKVFDTEGVAPTQTSSMGKGWETKILV